MGGCLKAIGDGILSFLVLCVVLVWLASSFFDSEPGFDETLPEPPSGQMPGSAPDQADQPPTSEAQAQDGGRLLPAPSPFDDPSRVDAENAKTWSTGTGFAIGKGVWMTARHVVRGCESLGVVNDTGQTAVKARPLYISDNADVAILSTQGGPDPLALDLDETDLRVGARGFHVGYPQGKPGEVTSRLIGRELMYTEGAWRGRENTLAWAETGRSANLRGTLGGLSGGPAFDATGRVLGVTIAENPRRGRVITTSADSVLDALEDARLNPDGTPVGTLDRAEFTSKARALRRSLKVMQVVCLPGS